MWMETESEIWAKADATVFGLLMGVNRTARRLLAADRTIDAAFRRVATLRRSRERKDARDHAEAEKQVAREFERSWGRSVRVRVPHASAKDIATWSKGRRGKSSSTTSRRAIRAYTTPLKDTRGRIALYFRIRYIGLKSKKWRPGLAADHVIYILREEAQENGEVDLEVMTILSNMGDNAEEIAAGWRALEAMEEGYRANAKIQYRIIWNLPHDLDANQRRELVQDFCERTFGRLGLPWVAAIHKADKKGDQRNYHAHICFSTRPCEHVGDHQWDISLEKVNGLTNEIGLKRMRALAAGHMNIACRDAGLKVRFTHQRYDERNIDAVRQEHVGPERMAAHERGESVAVIERNALIVERNEAAAMERELALSTRLVDATKCGLDVAAERARVTAGLATVQAIAGRARAMGKHASSRPTTIRAKVGRIAERARILRAAVAATPATEGLRLRRDQMSRIADTARAVGELQRQCDQRRMALASARNLLGEAKHRIAARDRANGVNRRRKAEALLLGAGVSPYFIRDRKIVLDASALAEEDASLVMSLNRDALGAAPRERYRRDREREAAEAQTAARTADEQRKAVERRRDVDEAVRILRHSPERPYRIEGRRIVPDLSALAAGDRDLVSRIGFDESALAAGLVERAREDRAREEHARQLDDERSRRERDGAERAAGDAEAANERRQALDRLLFAIEEERHYLAGKDGRRTVDRHVLARFGLSDGDIVGDNVQAWFAKIADKQSGEILRIQTYVERAPHHLRPQSEHWALDDEAPADVRELVASWRNDRTVQAALERVAGSRTPVTAPAPTPSKTEADPAGNAWRLARQFRDRAMADSDAVERLDGRDLTQPGRKIVRPGAALNDERPNTAGLRAGIAGPGWGR